MNSNPLLCDTESAACSIPSSGATHPSAATQVSAGPKPVHILYFTDPICSSCWGIEPQLRRLKVEYGENVDIEYRMGGLLPSWEVYNSGGISKPSDVAGHWDEVSHHYDMPIDGDVWLEDPLPSSYPPSIAFKAAQMQDEHKALLFLRKIREMVFMQKKNITRWEHLEAAAVFVGLDPVRLKADVEGPAKAAFDADLELARTSGVRGFPTLFFSDNNGNRLTLYGARPYAQFENILQTLLPDIRKSRFDTSVEGLFQLYPTLTSREFATLSNMERSAAEQQLEKLYEEHKLEKLAIKNGVLWIRRDR